MPELERLMLHRLAELDPLIRGAYADFDYKRIFAALNAFMTVDLSAFYFDIRKDALYCDPYSSVTRKACLTVLDHLFRCTVTWLAPMLCFTAEEAWLARDPAAASVHLELFPDVPAGWRDDALAEKWRKVRKVRRVVTGALEIERAAKAHRLLARSASDRAMSPIPSSSPRWSTSTSPKSASPRARRWSKARGPPTASGSTMCRASRSCRAAPRAANARAPGKFRRRRPRSAISRRDPARRPGVARMGSRAQGGGVGGVADAAQRPVDRAYVWGPLSALGLAVAALAGVLDQASKLWLLYVFDLPGRARVAVASFVDLVLTWNAGISYGLFQQQGLFGTWALLAFKLAAVVLLWVWLARASSRLTAAALGLIIGGALGNAIDRLHWPGVMDFVFFHVDAASLELPLVCLQPGRRGHCGGVVGPPL